MPQSGPTDTPSEKAFQDRVKGVVRDMRAALTFDDAKRVWDDADAAGLLTQVSDETYQFMQKDFYDRWNKYPNAH